MKKSGFYIIKDSFFVDMNEPYLKGNKEGNRPHYYCFEDSVSGLYWMKYINKDLSTLEKAIGKNVEDASMLDTFSLEMFENIAYVMAKHADTNIPDTQEEWLDGFNTFSIYQVLPQLIELWGLNVQTDVSAKKTSSNRSPDDNTFIFASLRTAGY